MGNSSNLSISDFIKKVLYYLHYLIEKRSIYKLSQFNKILDNIH
jgi:hypothetical protein